MRGKYLFVFGEQRGELHCEVFADSAMEAQEKACEAFGVTQIKAPVFFTENYDCPRCSCKATECNYDT